MVTTPLEMTRAIPPPASRLHEVHVAGRRIMERLVPIDAPGYEDRGGESDADPARVVDLHASGDGRPKDLVYGPRVHRHEGGVAVARVSGWGSSTASRAIAAKGTPVPWKTTAAIPVPRSVVSGKPGAGSRMGSRSTCRILRRSTRDAPEARTMISVVSARRDTAPQASASPEHTAGIHSVDPHPSRPPSLRTHSTPITRPRQGGVCRASPTDDMTEKATMQ